MDIGKLRKFASFARTSLIEQVGTRLKTVLAEKSLARRESSKVVEELEKKIKDLGEKRVLETVAYTWFNRFCALRYMDVNRYTRIGILSPADGQLQPEILAEAKMGHIDEELVPEPTRKQVMRLLDGSDKSADPQGEAYRLLLVAVCNYYHSLMPFMFEKIADYTELLLPDDLLSGTSIPACIREALLPINCSPEYTEEAVEIIGWLYQFYIADQKDAVMARKAAVPTDDIPAVTQLFTPHWIVRYLVENSLGRLWMLNHPASRLRDRMPYYIEGESQTEFLKVSKPEEIRLLDPACGSGHMLTYAYDLLYAIYDEQGYAPAEIPGHILKHNLFGIEICDRAAALAAFALCMKARSSDSRYFRRVVQPNVIALQNVDIAEDELEDYVHELELGDLFSQPMFNLLHQFEEAKNFGSLIQPCLNEMEIQSARSEIENHKSKIENSPSQLFLRETHLRVLRVLEQAEALTQRYHVVVANPPYMGSNKFNTALKELTSTEFEDGKADLYSCFLLRNLGLVVNHGLCAMITLPNWMFLGSWAGLRRRLLTEFFIPSLVHNGRGLWGSDFGSCAFVVETSPKPEAFGFFKRLFDVQGEVNSIEELEQRFLDHTKRPPHRANARRMLKIPEQPIAYWVTDAVAEVFRTAPPLGSFGQPRQGFATGKNEDFLRRWSEVNQSNIGFNFANRPDAQRSGKTWFPCNKGGEFRRWYGNNDLVVDWRNDGERMRAFDGSVLRNQSYYFRSGMTWSTLTISRLSMRYSPQGFLFESKGSICFFDEELHRKYFLAFANSVLVERLMLALSPTADYHEGPMGRLPVVMADKATIDRVILLSSNATDAARADWDNFETSWDFRDQPLLRQGTKSATLAASWRNWDAQSTAAIRRMQELETENNRLFIAAYGLESELEPEVPEAQITLARADARRDMAALLSYAVGCMMGRYSPDHPGLILANAGDTLADFRSRILDFGLSVEDLKFMPDEDGVIPVLDGEWFKDDIVACTREFLRATFGEDTLEANLRFIEQSLGKDLRKYYLTDFYGDHLRTYKKRPIYWLFSSPKGTFNALIYMHRYRTDTAGKVLECLRDFRDKLSNHADHQQMVADSGNYTAKEKTAAIKQVATIKKQLKELEDYEKTLFEVAAKKISIDLDDGVKHNYPLFGSVLRKIPGLEGKED